MQTNRAGLFVGGCILALATVASAAFACTYQPHVFALSPIAGPSGQEVTVQGRGIAPQAVVEVRWNGVDGPKLAEAKADGQGNFSVKTAIPAASPDVYSLVAVTGQAGVARSSFEVTDPAASGPASDPGFASKAAQVKTDLWAGFSNATRDGAALSTQATAASGGASPGFGLGIALLGLGTFTLVTGAVAGARRRRLVREGI